MNIINRILSPTPPFFKKMRLAGLLITAAGGAMVGSPEGLPEIVNTIGGYLIVAGGVVASVSQTAINEK